MRIAVLGSSGGMGSLLAKYFISKGHEVVGFDPNKGVSIRGLVKKRSGQAAVRGANVVVLAPPIDLTLRVLEEVLPHLEAKAKVVEITSVKHEILPKLRRMTSERGVRLLSLHPLFGPSLPLQENAAKKIAVITTEGAESLRLARKLFPDARLIPMDLVGHDREVALVLSLTHLVGIAYMGVVGKHSGVERFKELASPASLLQLTVAESVLAQDPSLCSYMEVKNPSTLEFLRYFEDELGTLKSILSHHDRRRFEEKFTDIARLFSKEEAARAIARVYRAVESNLE